MKKPPVVPVIASAVLVVALAAWLVGKLSDANTLAQRSHEEALQDRLTERLSWDWPDSRSQKAYLFCNGPGRGKIDDTVITEKDNKITYICKNNETITFNYHYVPEGSVK